MRPQQFRLMVGDSVGSGRILQWNPRHSLMALSSLEQRRRAVQRLDLPRAQGYALLDIDAMQNTIDEKIRYALQHFPFLQHTDLLAFFSLTDAAVCAVPASHWLEFWDTMETIGGWQWERRYYHPFIVDGMTWSIYIEQAGQVLRSSGNFAVPPGFRQFCTAVEMLIEFRIAL
jgi:hypothetical protein